MGDESGEFTGGEADSLAHPCSHRPFDGGRPRSHFVDRHHLVGDRPDHVKQGSQRDRTGDLMTDIPRMVQVVAVAENRPHALLVVLGELRRIGFESGAGVFQPVSCPLNAVCWFGPVQNRAVPGFHSLEVFAKNLREPPGECGDQLRRIRRFDPLTRILHCMGGEVL